MEEAANMCTILLSIKPKYVKKIFSGEKKYEYRRRIAKKTVDRILIYETAPTKAIVGEVSVDKLLSLTPDKLWERTQPFAGISKKEFDDYFSGLEKSNAYRLFDARRYHDAVELSEYGLVCPPQSFCYLNKLGEKVDTD